MHIFISVLVTEGVKSTCVQFYFSNLTVYLFLQCSLEVDFLVLKQVGCPVRTSWCLRHHQPHSTFCFMKYKSSSITQLQPALPWHLTIYMFFYRMLCRRVIQKLGHEHQETKVLQTKLNSDLQILFYCPFMYILWVFLLLIYILKIILKEIYKLHL